MSSPTLLHPSPPLCGWCDRPIPAGARADAIYCRTLCRQSAWRFSRGRQLRAASSQPMRFAYADPPYPGQSSLYREHPAFGGEVDHRALIEYLARAFPAGWALSTSAEALPAILPLCPPGWRIGAWLRGERPAESYRPLSAWEPVIYVGGRAYKSPVDQRRIDALEHRAAPRRSDPRRVIGAKPAAFCWWLFDLLGAVPGDELVDLFPGSGGIGRAWSLYTSAGPQLDTSQPGGGDTSAAAASDAYQRRAG